MTGSQTQYLKLLTVLRIVPVLTLPRPLIYSYFSDLKLIFYSFTGDLLYYGGVEWLNISDFLGKIKKGLELHAMCFVFKSAVVFLCKERLRQKKKLMVSIPNRPTHS